MIIIDENKFKNNKYIFPFSNKVDISTFVGQSFVNFKYTNQGA